MTATEQTIPATMHRRFAVRTLEAEHIVFTVRVPRPAPPKPPTPATRTDRVLTAGVWISLAWSLASFGVMLAYVNPLIHFQIAWPVLAVLTAWATLARHRAVPLAAIAGLVALAVASTI